jgi:oligoribonuclease NrnB/cAMP/cGMP phosphodiesterase (DHH superfamily)
MWSKFGNDAEYVVGRYQSDDMPDFKDRVVFLVDFSYPVSTLVEHILPVANKVYVIDHHKTALNAYMDVEAENLDMRWSSMDHSGAVLAWLFINNISVEYDYLAPQVPFLLRVIEDYDLWKFNFPSTRAICTALFSRNLSIGDFSGLMFAGTAAINNLQQEGELLVKVQMKRCEDVAKKTIRTIPISLDYDLTVNMPVVNAGTDLANDIGELLTVIEHPFVAIYYDNEKHRVFSLRSNEKNANAIDVSKIALAYGGGGHKHAAGFKVARDHYLARA